MVAGGFLCCLCGSAKGLRRLTVSYLLLIRWFLNDTPNGVLEFATTALLHVLTSWERLPTWPSPVPFLNYPVLSQVLDLKIDLVVHTTTYRITCIQDFDWLMEGLCCFQHLSHARGLLRFYHGNNRKTKHDHLPLTTFEYLKTSCEQGQLCVWPHVLL